MLMRAHVTCGPQAFLRIFAALGPPSGASAAASLGFAAGSRVRVHGLARKPEYNGKGGTVLGAQGGERVQVRLADGTELALKPANLVGEDDAAGGAVDMA